jgi:hypothetical protein
MDVSGIAWKDFDLFYFPELQYILSDHLDLHRDLNYKKCIVDTNFFCNVVISLRNLKNHKVDKFTIKRYFDKLRTFRNKATNTFHGLFISNYTIVSCDYIKKKSSMHDLWRTMIKIEESVYHAYNFTSFHREAPNADYTQHDLFVN